MVLPRSGPPPPLPPPPPRAPEGDNGDEASEAGSSGTEEYYDSDDDRVEARFERYSKVTVAPGAVPTTGTLDGMD